MAQALKRYRIYPIADAECRVIVPTLLFDTDDLIEAKCVAATQVYVFGVGIEDAQEGTLDVGFGFGVPCPEVES